MKITIHIPETRITIDVEGGNEDQLTGIIKPIIEKAQSNSVTPKKKYEYKAANYPRLQELLETTDMKSLVITKGVSIQYIRMLINGTRKANTKLAKEILSDLNKLADINAAANRSKEFITA